MAELLFLKLGGSLITDKTRPYTARTEKLAELAGEIAAARGPDLRLVLGHGSGSFGHTAASEFRTREGLAGSRAGAAHPDEFWRGFAEVRLQAARLNHLVMEALQRAGIPSLAFPPSAAVLARAGQIQSWDLTPLRAALDRGLLPVVYGDVVLDADLGGTILSTEDLFAHLALQLRPARILLAGLEQGVWQDFPARTQFVSQITPRSFETLRAGMGTAVGTDVTGGMESKVRQMLTLAKDTGASARIFSGETSGNVTKALRGEAVGTHVAA